MLTTVIHEVDQALLSLIEQQAVDTTDVETVLDAPTKEWASRRNAPTINCYLYDIREDLRRRYDTGAFDPCRTMGDLTATHIHHLLGN